jgi:hypothetical protein
VISPLKGFNAINIAVEPNAPAAPIAFYVIDQPLIQPSEKGALGYANTFRGFNRT